MSPQLTCIHRCRCGAELHCGDPDRCPIGSREWLCEACELDAVDDYMNRAEAERTDAREPQQSHR